MTDKSRGHDNGSNRKRIDFPKCAKNRYSVCSKKSQKYKVAHPSFSLSAIGPDDVGLTRNINENPRSRRYTRGT